MSSVPCDDISGRKESGMRSGICPLQEVMWSGNYADSNRFA